jgi:hypothetical protein
LEKAINELTEMRNIIGFDVKLLQKINQVWKYNVILKLMVNEIHQCKEKLLPDLLNLQGNYVYGEIVLKELKLVDN